MYTIKIFVIILAISVHQCTIIDSTEAGNLVPLTVDENPSLPSLVINGTLLHVETVGNPSDPIIILLHGGPGGDNTAFSKSKSFSSDGFFVVSFDQRGSGLSRRHSDKSLFTHKVFFEDLRQLINHFKLNVTHKVFLLGHSWGAMYATGFTNKYPDMVNGLVLSEPGGFTWSDMMSYVEKTRALELFSEALNDALWTEQFISSNSHELLDYRLASFSIGESNTGDIKTPPFTRFGAFCSNSMFEHGMEVGLDYTTNLTAYTNKVLFLYSELNISYGFDHAKKVSSAFSNVELIEIKGAGHMLTHFSFDQYHTKALTYLNERLL